MSTLEIEQIKFQIDQDEKKEAMERKLQQEKREEEEQLRKKRGGRLQPIPKTDEEKQHEEEIRKRKLSVKESRKRRTKVLEQVLRVVEVANSRAQEFNHYAVPFQALWRGHVARCKHGPGK